MSKRKDSEEYTLRIITEDGILHHEQKGYQESMYEEYIIMRDKLKKGLVIQLIDRSDRVIMEHYTGAQDNPYNP